MHMYSKNLSTTATYSSLILTELLPAGFCCINYFILSHSSLGSDDKNFVFEKDFFEKPEAETFKLGDLIDFNKRSVYL